MDPTGPSCPSKNRSFKELETESTHKLEPADPNVPVRHTLPIPGLLSTQRPLETQFQSLSHALGPEQEPTGNAFLGALWLRLA